MSGAKFAASMQRRVMIFFCNILTNLHHWRNGGGAGSTLQAPAARATAGNPACARTSFT
jgi:hypothetical protein